MNFSRPFITRPIGTTLLVIGLFLSVALMGAAANVIARLLERFRWIIYLGLAIVLYVALSMIWHGGHDVIKAIN